MNAYEVTLYISGGHLSLVVEAGSVFDALLTVTNHSKYGQGEVTDITKSCRIILRSK